jgi:hypothetical protein
MALSIADMRTFLSRSYSSVNQNKVNGIHAEVAFYDYIVALGFADRVSPGGWIIRPNRVQSFGLSAVAVFPDDIPVDQDLSTGTPPAVPESIDAAASFLRSASIATYFCYPIETAPGLQWLGLLRGHPSPPQPEDINDLLVNGEGFARRRRPYNFLRYSSDVSRLSDKVIAAQLPLEALRIYIHSGVYGEISDIDRLLWGQNTIYPVEVKEKTRVRDDPAIGDWFGIDVGTFAKLAYFAAWHGRLRSLFVVREIVDPDTRELMQWWAADFETVAKRASWVFRGGGPTMGGMASAVLQVPIDAFRVLDPAYMASL